MGAGVRLCISYLLLQNLVALSNNYLLVHKSVCWQFGMGSAEEFLCIMLHHLGSHVSLQSSWLGLAVSWMVLLSCLGLSPSMWSLHMVSPALRGQSRLVHRVVFQEGKS